MSDRTWQAGDPEPHDTEAVVDCEDDVWVREGWNAWYVEGGDPAYAVAWISVLEYAPLTEVPEGGA